MHIRSVLASVLVTVLTLAMVHPAQAQSPVPARAHLRTILEKTFLKVDVLALDVCLDPATAGRLGEVAAQKRSRALEDSVARIVLAAGAVDARIRFLRDVNYSQFIGGILEEQQNAVEAGMLADSTRRAVSGALPDWFSFLENRNIARDETLTYRIRGDSIRTTFTDLRGEALLDRTDTGYWRRTSVLATWMARGSGFRNGLIESVWKPAAVTVDAVCAELGSF